MIFREEFKKDFSFYIQVVLIFSFILGIGYLFGFWWTVDVNIFPFLSLFDLIKFSACPLLILFVPLILLQWIITEWHVTPYLDRIAKKLTLNTPRSSRRIVLVVILFYFVVVIGIGIFFKIATLSIGVPAASIIGVAWFRNVGQKENLDSEPATFLRFGRALPLLCLLPFISYDFGRYKAVAILKDKEYSYIWVNTNGNKELYKFLGFINGHYFFLDRKNHILLINNNVSSLELHKFLRKGENDNPEIGFT
jgi:hypothetical protein